MKVRIGIDVGGTFTDAVAIDDSTYEIVGQVKIPTTHTAEEGVARGIVQALRSVMEQGGISAREVNFIAHGTTQATNALLEGDVAKVGVVSMGRGIEGMKSKKDCQIGDIPLTDTKKLHSETQYIEVKDDASLDNVIREALAALREKNCESFVAAEAFSVDHPEHERLAVEICTKKGVPGTATNVISKLYGLKIRTRTAVVNASIMPKMLETARLTEESIRAASIESPLMVMRCDGGVMTVEEMRRRPILTILSGPAAGVAGALMYEKLTDGLFFEVGGTSTDISCVKDGKVMLRYAEVGGHKTYLNSLDVRTVGIGGGSMIVWRDGRMIDVGPRSAHIADLDYEVYADDLSAEGLELHTCTPRPGDPEYAYVKDAGGRKFALTLAGAANVAGCVQAQDYAGGNRAAARNAWALVGKKMGMTAEAAAKLALKLAANKNAAVATALMNEYEMDPRTTVFVGGGGGASVVVPHLAERFGQTYRLAKNAPIISTIGVALAMVRDMVERTVSNPTQEDILSIRREAERRAIENGAAADSIEVEIEVDAQRNLLRAVATGATELRSKDLLSRLKSDDELLAIVAGNLAVEPSALTVAARCGGFLAVKYEKVEKKCFGLFRKREEALRLIDREGVIRLQKSKTMVLQSRVNEWPSALRSLLEETTIYNDGGANRPNVYLAVGARLLNWGGLTDEEQILALGELELSGFSPDEPLILMGSSRS